MKLPTCRHSAIYWPDLQDSRTNMAVLVHHPPLLLHIAGSRSGIYRQLR